jgi:predicted AAA+ superfamily ATPase
LTIHVIGSRTAQLAPDLEELSAFSNAPTDLYTTLWQGSYPRIYDRNIPAHQWLADYVTTYIQRDVRQVIKNHVIYGGEDSQQRTQAQLLSWRNTLRLL